MIKRTTFSKDITVDRNVACIGLFDGVHKGHQKLIEKTVELANDKGLLPVLITFDPDPYVIISDKNNQQITNLKERIKLFERFGIKEVLIIPFDKETMNLSTQSFKNDILDKLNIDTLVCGKDFTYGYKGQGNYKSLKKDGMKIVTVDEFTYYGKKVSSTRIRNEINKGNYSLVNKLLGYEYKG